MKNLIFIGMIGSDFKIIAEKVASILNKKYVDTDEVLTRNTGLSLHDFYTLIPMESFNDLTLRLASQLAAGEDYIIAVGDSILNNAEAMSALKKTGFIVYLNQNIDSIVTDCKDTSHPLLARGLYRLYELFEEREKLFDNSSDIVIAADKNAAQSAIDAFNAALESAEDNIDDPALFAFFRYYIEAICPEADSASFAKDCSVAVSELTAKYISEVKADEH